jgi:hypothetical protein
VEYTGTALGKTIDGAQLLAHILGQMGGVATQAQRYTSVGNTAQFFLTAWALCGDSGGCGRANGYVAQIRATLVFLK